MQNFKIPKFNFEILEPYKQIIIFVQKVNDLDTCACAAAIAELINIKFKKTKKIFASGVHCKSRFLPELKKYSGTKIDYREKAIAILSEVSDLRQLNKTEINDLKKVDEIIIFDHHESNHQEIKEIAEGKIIHFFHDTSYTSVCEVFWDAVKDSMEEIPTRIAEMLFMGLYGDTKAFTSERMDSKTFQHVSEMIDRCNLNPSKMINFVNQKPVANLQLFADTMKDAHKEKNLIFASLNPRNAIKRVPRLFYKEKGKLKQKKLLTYIPRWIEQFASVHTIVFVHYSLFDPFNSTKKIVYIILVKENPAIEQILTSEGFRKNRNRWSREMEFYDLTTMLEKYKNILTA